MKLLENKKPIKLNFKIPKIFENISLPRLKGGKIARKKRLKKIIFVSVGIFLLLGFLYISKNMNNFKSTKEVIPDNISNIDVDLEYRYQNPYNWLYSKFNNNENLD